MAAVKRTRPQIGDVIEIPTPVGLAYAHYTHKHDSPPRYGALIRVLPGIYGFRPTDFSLMVEQEPQFITFFPLGAACSKKIVSVVANETVPSSATSFPVFRTSIRTRQGYGPWWLWDGVSERMVGKLEPQMKHLPIRGVINDTLLVERIVQGWRHERDA
jgi:hypothetical protein